MLNGEVAERLKAPLSKSGLLICLINGEMTEMAEGARLESVCTVTGTEGSNPSLSAI